MGPREMASQLAKVPIFSGCSRKELELIARSAKVVSHKAGAVLAREGEPGVGLFLILDGSAEVTIGGRRKAVLGKGDFFGEVALLDGGPRTATVTATSAVTIAGITEWVFRSLLLQHPSIALRTLETVAARLRSASKDASA